MELKGKVDASMTIENLGLDPVIKRQMQHEMVAYHNKKKANTIIGNVSED